MLGLFFFDLACGIKPHVSTPSLPKLLLARGRRFATRAGADEWTWAQVKHLGMTCCVLFA